MRQIEPAATRFFINARQPAQSEPSLMLPDAAAGCTMPSAETAPRAREHNRPPSPPAAPPAAPPGRLPFPDFGAALRAVAPSRDGTRRLPSHDTVPKRRANAQGGRAEGDTEAPRAVIRPGRLPEKRGGGGRCSRARRTEFSPPLPSSLPFRVL